MVVAASVGVVLVFLIVLVALVLFLTEPVPIDVTAIGIMVTLTILGPWTGVSPQEGVSGFSNPATITIFAITVLIGIIVANRVFQGPFFGGVARFPVRKR